MPKETESFTEQCSRVRQMSEDVGGETWDLSDNDRAALKAVMDVVDSLPEICINSGCHVAYDYSKRDA